MINDSIVIIRNQAAGETEPSAALVLNSVLVAATDTEDGFSLEQLEGLADGMAQAVGVFPWEIETVSPADVSATGVFWELDSTFDITQSLDTFLDALEKGDVVLAGDDAKGAQAHDIQVRRDMGGSGSANAIMDEDVDGLHQLCKERKTATDDVLATPGSNSPSTGMSV